MNKSVFINTLKLHATVSEDCRRAITILRTGGLVALPTETVYGLAAHALCPLSIKKVFRAKGRPQNNPLILHTHDSVHARQLFTIHDENVVRRLELLSALWPGPLTIVAPKAAHIPLEATGGLEHVAVRIPRSKVTLDILQKLSFPLVMPSANLSTRPSPTEASHVLKTLHGRIEAVLDDGACEVGIESTVVRIDTLYPMILRPGHFDAVFLSQVLGEKVVYEKGNKHQPSCPGQAYVHYAPKVKEVIVADEMSFAREWFTKSSMLARKSDIEKIHREHGERHQEGLTLALSDEPHLFAQQLYGALYRCEDFAQEKVYILLPDGHGDVWNAIADRLKRSSGIL